MPQQLDRREFLKILSLLPLTYYVRPDAQSAGGQQNIIVIVFDALSALNLGLYAYPRDTAPNIDRFAQKATVYHKHYAAGNYTSPGTASLLTGTLPWTHQATTYNSRAHERFEGQNIFSHFSDYHRVAYTHNPLANQLLLQFIEHIDQLKNIDSLYVSSDSLINKILKNDYDIGSLSWTRFMKKGDEGHAYSLLLSEIYRLVKEAQIKDYHSAFPRGIPAVGKNENYLLEDAVNWMLGTLETLPSPFLGYFHFYPPHSPYYSRKEFVDIFSTAASNINEQPEHIFTQGIPFEQLNRSREFYDEFIRYADAEFGRILEFLETNALLENTWVVLTSDHGEIFERGIRGHTTPALFEPLLRIPLLISQPGQQSRQDVYAPTSAIDILPTLSHVTGRSISTWSEGEVLPPYNPKTSDQRSIFAVEARKSQQFSPLSKASISLIQGNHKLSHYYGYDELETLGPVFELYNLEEDPGETKNLYEAEPSTAAQLRNELLGQLNEKNAALDKSQ